MSDDMKMKIFLQTVNQFFGIELVSGVVEILGSSRLIWNSREITLDRKEAILLISRQKKKNEDHIFYLKNYTI